MFYMTPQILSKILSVTVAQSLARSLHKFMSVSDVAGSNPPRFQEHTEISKLQQDYFLNQAIFSNLCSKVQSLPLVIKQDQVS